MPNPFEHISHYYKGRFIADPLALSKKLEKIKAYVFDWDGVFNDGYKNESGSSPFSEIDSMGTNLLRFNHFLRTGENPFFLIISGEKNQAAFALAQREHFQVVYYSIKNKQETIYHLCDQYKIEPAEVAFVFDDVLDLSAARIVGLRLMVAHAANPMLVDFALRQGLADYITHQDGKHHAVREAAELLMTLSGRYDDTILHRMDFSELYQQYLNQRQAVATRFITIDSSGFIQSLPV